MVVGAHQIIQARPRPSVRPPVPVVLLVVRHGRLRHIVGRAGGRRRDGRRVIVDGGVGPVDALRALGPPLGLARRRRRRLGLLQLLLRLLELLRVCDHGWRLWVKWMAGRIGSKLPTYSSLTNASLKNGKTVFVANSFIWNVKLIKNNS